MKQTTFYLVRHGEADWNIDKLHMGHTDRQLTERGKIQAEELAEKLKDIEIAAIYSSDLSRAKDTAEVIAKKRNLSVTLDPRLREKFGGGLEGRHHSELASLYTNWDSLTSEEKMDYSIEGEETIRQTVGRVVEALKDIAEKEGGKTILITTHSGPIRFLLISLGFGDFAKIGGIDNCGYVKLIFNGNSFTIEETVGIKSWKEKQS